MTSTARTMAAWAISIPNTWNGNNAPGPLFSGQDVLTHQRRSYWVAGAFCIVANSVTHADFICLLCPLLLATYGKRMMRKGGFELIAAGVLGLLRGSPITETWPKHNRAEAVAITTAQTGRLSVAATTPQSHRPVNGRTANCFLSSKNKAIG